MQDERNYVGVVRRRVRAWRVETTSEEIGELAGGPIAPSGPPIIGNGLTLAHAAVQMVYWGSAWDQLAALRAQIDAAARSMLSSRYVLDLAEYKATIGVGSVIGSTVLRTPEPHNGFTPNNVKILLRDAMDDGSLAQPLDENNVYLVFTPPGIEIPSIVGAHARFLYEPVSGAQSRRVHDGWVTSQSGNLDDYTCTMSHEIVELITDPEFDGITFPNPGGLDEVPEIADMCDECYRLAEGTRVQAWFSAAHGGCYKPQ